jgi:threonine dehydrogenase-like Zn-dependent dehydrogenase
LHDLFRGDDEPVGLFNDFVSVAGDTASIGLPLMPFAPLPLTELASQMELSPQALSAALHCISARAGRTSQAENFLGEIYRYDIPLGQSPAVKSDSLLQLLETSKKVCLAPLAIGGAHAVSQLTQGSYVAALLTTGTAGVMTLVLIGTVSVGALIVQRVAQARARTEQSSGSNTPPTAPTRRRRQSGGGNATAA